MHRAPPWRPAIQSHHGLRTSSSAGALLAAGAACSAPSSSKGCQHTPRPSTRRAHCFAQSRPSVRALHASRIALIAAHHRSNSGQAHDRRPLCAGAAAAAAAAASSAAPSAPNRVLHDATAQRGSSSSSSSSSGSSSRSTSRKSSTDAGRMGATPASAAGQAPCWAPRAPQHCDKLAGGRRGPEPPRGLSRAEAMAADGAAFVRHFRCALARVA